VGLSVRCFAKINTVLRVLGRRPDGYHDLDLDFFALELHDTLAIEPARGFSLDVTGASLPTGDNLVLRAATALQRERPEVPGARMTLTKRIPVAAGLGGGSSDAAAALLGLDRLYGLGLRSEELARLALGLGSDVPFFLRGGRQRGRGRGERLDPLPDRPLHVLLLNPGQPLSTRDVFEEHARAASAVLTSRNNGTSFPPEGWWSSRSVVVHDDLVPAAVRLLPAVGELLEAAAGAFPEGTVGMTGSGPTVFVVFDAEPADALGRAAGLHAGAWLTRTLSAPECQATRFAPDPAGG
jgi:4-diphosphocytidyl-2-C-methyl-D-erythritol kinase